MCVCTRARALFFHRVRASVFKCTWVNSNRCQNLSLCVSDSEIFFQCTVTVFWTFSSTSIFSMELLMSSMKICWGSNFTDTKNILSFKRTLGETPGILKKKLKTFFFLVWGAFLDPRNAYFFIRMAGCTSRCHQGVLKLIQSLQRLVSGTLTKGTFKCFSIPVCC